MYLSFIRIRISIALIACLLPNFGVALPAMSDGKTPSLIVFPGDDHSGDCFAGPFDTVKGTCKSLADCPSVVEQWKNQNIQPQTCRFNGFEQIVCCPLVLRRSAKDCQDRKESKGFRVAITHGLPTRIKEFPYMAALGWQGNSGNPITFRCGGVLIAPHFVLTAAHCADFRGSKPTSVRIGGSNLTDTDENIPIKRIIIHPKYEGNSVYNDIALMELQHDSNEDPVCIWGLEEASNEVVTAIGYGHTKFAGPSSDQLLKAELSLIANNECQQFYSGVLPRGVIPSQVCAKDPEQLRDTCQGDSGGPIVQRVTEEYLNWYVIGITSFGRGCAGEPPGVYTRVSAFVDWIEDIVWPLQ